MKPNNQTSKFLSLVLRHNPQKIGLTLDPSGWVSVETLLAALAKHGHPLTRPQLEEIVSTNEKKRFAFNEDKTQIRASQGHSIPVELGYQAQPPPPLLYHGTATRFEGSIRKQGILKGDRHHVHLSADKETATKVGQRHGQPVVLTIDAPAMVSQGHVFLKSENGVWLTDHVPPQFLL